MNSPKFIRNLTLLIVTICGLFLLHPPTTLAYPGPITCKTLSECQKLRAKDWNDAVYGTQDMNLQSYVNEVFNNLLFSIAGLVLPSDQIPPDPTQLLNSFLNIKAKLSQGENPLPENLAFLANNPITLLLTTPPASGVSYVRSIAQNFSLIPRAEAISPGFGYSQLDSFRGIWQAARNASYSFFIIFFIAAGFMVMFRVKVSPQVVLTIESLLPKAVVALLLITFSYAIVGFAIDIMYVISYLLISIVSPYTLLVTGGNFVGNILKFFGGLVGSAIPLNPLNGTGTAIVQNSFNLPFTISSLVPLALVYISGFIAASEITFLLLLPGTILTALPTAGLSIVASTVISGTVGIIAAIVVFIVTLWYTFKIVMVLVKAYLNVFIALITGPFQILFGIMPGSNSVSQWIMGLISNLAVFPTVYLMFLFIEVVTTTAINNGGGSSGTWIPPLLAPNINALGVSNGLITSLAGTPANILIRCILIMGIYFLIPKAAEIIKALIERKPFPYDTAIGEAWSTAKTYGVPVGTVASRAGWEAARGSNANDRWGAFRRTAVEQGKKVAADIAEKQTGIRFRPEPVTAVKTPPTSSNA